MSPSFAAPNSTKELKRVIPRFQIHRLSSNFTEMKPTTASPNRGQRSPILGLDRYQS
jgi:hypothetical protein